VTVRFTNRADKDYVALSPNVRKVFGKQLEFLLVNLRNPSLRAKKLEGPMIFGRLG
jgi:mRNA-degrading endonuclease RelE of RelBE toxin-antitoxin system